MEQILLSLRIEQGIALILNLLLTLLILFLAWRVLPRRILALLQWMDRLIPADLSSLVKPLSRIVVLLFSAVILGLAGLLAVTTLGFNTRGVIDPITKIGVLWVLEVLPRLLRISFVLLTAWVVSRVLWRLLPSLVEQAVARRAGEEALAAEVRKRTSTLQNVISNSFGALVWVMAFFLTVSELGVDIAPLLAGAGVVGIAVGFGAQNLIRDYLAGVIVLMEDQYRVGDVVRIAGVAGVVEDFNLRRTVLRDLDFIVHVVPNGEVRVASNFTKEKSRVNLNISVAYKEDLDRVIAVLNQVGQELSKDPYFGPLITDPIKVLRVDAFEDSGIAIKVIGETLPIRQWDVAGEFRRRIKRVFDEQGIEIPFPHRTIYWGTGVETRIRQDAGDVASPASASSKTEADPAQH